tara:strand:+ start:1037 stop:1474 length:438 start_codon:yes stop_codon:yes gene_type:complete
MKSYTSRKKLFREFAKKESKDIPYTNLKNIHFLYKEAKDIHELGRAELDFIMFIYDYEFFTIEHIAKALNKSESRMRKRLIYKMVSDGWVYKHFDKLTPSASVEDSYFRDETKYNYRVRYAITQRGRLVVTRLYRKMNGEEPFKT